MTWGKGINATFLLCFFLPLFAYAGSGASERNALADRYNTQFRLVADEYEKALGQFYQHKAPYPNEKLAKFHELEMQYAKETAELRNKQFAESRAARVKREPTSAGATSASPTPVIFDTEPVDGSNVPLELDFTPREKSTK